MIAAVSVLSTVTDLTAPETTPLRSLLVANNGAETIYVKLDSSSTVLTTANGFPIAAGAAFSFDKLDFIRATIQAIAVTGPVDVRVQSFT